MTFGCRPMIAEMTIIIFVFAFLAGILLYAWREMLEWGQVVYIVVCAALVICSFFFVPFRNPINNSIVVGFRWSPPTYIDKSADLGMTEEIYRALKNMPDVEVADDYVEKSQTKEMNYSHRISRHIRTALVLCILRRLVFCSGVNQPGAIQHRFGKQEI